MLHSSLWPICIPLAVGPGLGIEGKRPRNRDVLSKLAMPGLRTGNRWSPVRTLPVVPLWCDLGRCSLTVVVIKLLLTSALEGNMLKKMLMKLLRSATQQTLFYYTLGQILRAIITANQMDVPRQRKITLSKTSSLSDMKREEAIWVMLHEHFVFILSPIQG